MESLIEYIRMRFMRSYRECLALEQLDYGIGLNLNGVILKLVNSCRDLEGLVYSKLHFHLYVKNAV